MLLTWLLTCWQHACNNEHAVKLLSGASEHFVFAIPGHYQNKIPAAARCGDSNPLRREDPARLEQDCRYCLRMLARSSGHQCKELPAFVLLEFARCHVLSWQPHATQSTCLAPAVARLDLLPAGCELGMCDVGVQRATVLRQRNFITLPCILQHLAEIAMLVAQ